MRRSVGSNSSVTALCRHCIKGCGDSNENGLLLVWVVGENCGCRKDICSLLQMRTRNMLQWGRRNKCLEVGAALCSWEVSLGSLVV